MKIRNLLFFVIVILQMQAFSANVNISGTAMGAEGRVIHVYVYQDLMTNLQKEIANAKIDGTGAFSVEADITKIETVVLSIDFHLAEIFIEPGKNYEVEIAPQNYNNIAELNPFIESQALEVTILNLQPDDLNKLISDFNAEYNEFTLKHFNELYRDKKVDLLKDFVDKVHADFPDTVNEYFAAYKAYKIAGLEQIAHSMGTQQMMKKYFTSRPVLYNNVEYMDFFNLFFQKYILAVSRPLKFIDYPGMLDKAESYQNIMKALTADTNLKRNDLRELVLLHGLSEMYYEPGYRQESVLKLIGEISKNSKYPEHRIIAQDLITQITKLKKGTPAPGFTLNDRNKKPVSLSDFKGKPVMLSFWTTYCQDCILKLESLKPLVDKYGEGIAFVSISADKSFTKMQLYLNLKNNFTWYFLHIGESIDLLKDYNVKSYPLFVIIDKNGMIYDSQAPMPGEGLETEIETMVNSR